MTKGPKLQGTQSGKVLWSSLINKTCLCSRQKGFHFSPLTWKAHNGLLWDTFLYHCLSLYSNEIISQKLWTSCQCLLLLKTSKGQNGIIQCTREELSKASNRVMHWGTQIKCPEQNKRASEKSSGTTDAQMPSLTTTVYPSKFWIGIWAIF